MCEWDRVAMRVGVPFLWLTLGPCSALLVIRRSDQVRALGKSRELEFDGVHDMLVGLTTGRGPTRKEAKDCSEFYRQVLGRIQYFYVREEIEQNGRQKPKTKTCVGMVALSALRAEVAHRFEDNVGVDAAEDLRHSRLCRTHSSLKSWARLGT